jgi:hypothetical protein
MLVCLPFQDLRFDIPESSPPSAMGASMGMNTVEGEIVVVALPSLFL